MSIKWTRILSIPVMAVPVIPAWMGMDFSPSFTTAFVLAGVILTGIGELTVILWGENRSAQDGAAAGPGLRGVKRPGVRTVIGTAAFVLGLACSLPASFIYATGDDFLMYCVGGALAGGVAAGLLLTGKEPSAFGFLIAWFSWASALFTFLCGLRSPALLPYGIGMILQCLAFFGRRKTGRGKGKKNGEGTFAEEDLYDPAAAAQERKAEVLLRLVLAWTGAMLSALFNLAPAIF